MSDCSVVNGDFAAVVVLVLVYARVFVRGGGSGECRGRVCLGGGGYTCRDKLDKAHNDIASSKTYSSLCLFAPSAADAPVTMT